jgi:hypothetical protein
MIMCGALCIAMGAVAHAQEPDAFRSTQRELRVGERVSITDTDGRLFQGRISRMAADELELQLRSGGMMVLQVHPRADIARIRKRDRTWDGTLAGLGVGVTAGLFVGWRGIQNQEGPGFLLPYAFGGIGALVGYVGDALSGNRVVYQAPLRESPR